MTVYRKASKSTKCSDAERAEDRTRWREPQAGRDSPPGSRALNVIDLVPIITRGGRRYLDSFELFAGFAHTAVFRISNQRFMIEESPPSRGRGSETRISNMSSSRPIRRPFAGAWIETGTRSAGRSARGVAPFAGAWIQERHRAARLRRAALSSLRGGVDRNNVHTDIVGASGGVAPFAGAWIETAATLRAWSAKWSPPSRGRGSKPPGQALHDRRAASPPSRGRGSKHVARRVKAHALKSLAPYAGAWIETTLGRSRPFDQQVAPAGAWIETLTS